MAVADVAAAAEAPSQGLKLKDLMGLPGAGQGTWDSVSDYERALPSAAVRCMAVHKGGACALAAQAPGARDLQA